MKAIAILLLLFSFYSLLFSAPVGINAGAQFDTSAVNKVVDSKAKWVRINFVVQSGWSGPDDPKFKAAYDSIVNAYYNKGIKMFGLIGSESTDTGYNRNNPGAFVDPLTRAASSIIGRYRDRVKVFEIFNEPNDWNGGSSAQVSPYWFAKFLQSVYEQKYYQGWNVTIVSGPLFSHDQDTGADYIYNTYVAGMDQLAWDWFHQNANTYPIDGLGYHIYVAQGSTDSGTVSRKVNSNINAFWQAVKRGENYKGLEPSVSKKIWITEIGWPETAVGADGVAKNIKTSINAINTLGNVGLTLWFTLKDFENDNRWGLIDQAGNKKSSYYAFQSVAEN